MSDIFYITGPTGVGKSEIAAEVAARTGAEIIGADALQIYAGFPLLTAKPPAAVLSRAPHHLIGSAPADQEYSVARYLADATACRDAIWSRGRLALVVGGSGLYLKALTHGLSTLPPAQPTLRGELDALNLSVLNRRLAELDPVAAATIDQKNKRRLVRAIEVCIATGRRFSEHRSEWTRPSTARGVLVLRDKAELNERINQRVDEMFAAGVIEEARTAGPVGSTAAKMIGLDALVQVLRGEMSEQAARERIAAETRQYAKRQLTWFKRESAFLPLLISSAAEDAADRVLQILEAA